MVLGYLWRRSYIIIYIIYNKIYNRILFLLNRENEISINYLCKLLNEENDLHKKIDIFKNYLSLELDCTNDLLLLIKSFLNLYKNNLNSEIDAVEIIIWRFYNLDVFNNDPNRLLKLYNLAILFGLYETAFKIRTSITDKVILGPLSIKRVLAKLEKNLKLTKNESIFLNIVNPDLFFYYQRSLGLNPKIGCNSSDKMFYNLINHQRVLVVGPLFEGELDIFQFDVVIFIKNQDNDTLSKFEKLSCVFYYNTSNIQNGSFENYYSKYSNRGVFCIKNSINKYKSVEGIRQFRKNTSLLTGGPMMLQNIIFDLLFFYPSKIHITGFNFYQSPVFYNKNYHSTDWYNDLLFKRLSFSNHDLFSNFLFVKNAFNNNLITADSNTGNILLLPPSLYFKNLTCH